MSLIVWTQLIIVVVLGTVAQLALKAALDRIGSTQQHAASFLILSRSPLMWTWFGCYLASTLLWLWALRVVPLSQAFPILGLQFALVPLASMHFLKEDLLWGQWFGVIVIVLGVALVSRT